MKGNNTNSKQQGAEDKKNMKSDKEQPTSKENNSMKDAENVKGEKNIKITNEEKKMKNSNEVKIAKKEGRKDPKSMKEKPDMKVAAAMTAGENSASEKTKRNASEERATLTVEVSNVVFIKRNMESCCNVYVYDYA